jgi:hypothetical protein
VSNLFHAGLDLGRHRLEPLFLGRLQYEIESLLAAISEEFDILTGSRSPGEKLRSSRLNAVLGGLRIVVVEHLDKRRDRPSLSNPLGGLHPDAEGPPARRALGPGAGSGVSDWHPQIRGLPSSHISRRFQKSSTSKTRYYLRSFITRVRFMMARVGPKCIFPGID